MRSVAFRAEELGVDTVLDRDHLFPLSGDRDDRHFEVNPPPVRRIPILIGREGRAEDAADRRRARGRLARLRAARGSAARAGRPAAPRGPLGRGVAEIEIGNELRGETEESAQAFFDQVVRLFALGLGEPEIDRALVQRWLAWRDARNACALFIS